MTWWIWLIIGVLVLIIIGLVLLINAAGNVAFGILDALSGGAVSAAERAKKRKKAWWKL